MKEYIIVFSRHVDNWGAERSTCSLCKGLKDKGYNVLVIIPRIGEIIDLFENDNIEYLVYDFPGWLYEGRHHQSFKYICKCRFLELYRIFALKRLFQKRCIKPIIVYSNTLTFGFGIKFSKAIKAPHVQHIRENIDAFDYHFRDGYKKSMRLINSSAAIICTCNTIKQRYINDLSANKFFTVHNGVPSVKQPLQIDFDTPRLEIIQVARFMDDKRVIDSLNAIKILVDKGFVDIHLDIYGKGIEEGIYRKFISDNNLSNYIEIKGFVKLINFSLYHLGLMTSTFEAFSRSVLDYMNNGLAVVASNSGGNVEQVINEETGLLYEVKNPVSLANAIEVLYNDKTKLREFGEKSRLRFLNNFTQEKYVAGTNEIIIKILNNEQL